MTPTDDRGLPIGVPLGNWEPPRALATAGLRGRYVNLKPLSPSAHTGPLHHAFESADDSLWTYMSFGPFGDSSELEAVLEQLGETPGWLLFAVEIDDHYEGFLAYLRDEPHLGVVEIGSIVFGPSMQRTRAATEAIYLMIEHAFSCGYRRVEWKCDDLHKTSRRSAGRFGFTYEGTFRQATHYKGRNRDTAWFSIVDSEWPEIRPAYLEWLEPTNFSPDGTQIRKLSVRG